MPKLWILLGLLLAGCSSSGATEAPKAEIISCTAAYRSSVSQPIERDEIVTFTDNDAEQMVAFTDMVFHAAYNAGEANNERNLRVWVTDVGDSTVYHSTLYQFPTASGPQNQFVGGHGFTGLNYSYAPNSSAELQFWCEVSE